jgi:hypothetical protein
MPPRRAGASPRSGRFPRPPTRSWSWPSSWPARGSSGSWSSPPPTIGARSSICWRGGGWWCGWSTPTTSSTCQAGPRPTSWMRCGWPS